MDCVQVIDDVFFEIATVVDEIARVKCSGLPRPINGRNQPATCTHVLQAESKRHNALKNFWEYQESSFDIGNVDSMGGLSFIYNRNHGAYINLEKAEEFGGLFPHLYKKECKSGLLSPEAYNVTKSSNETEECEKLEESDVLPTVDEYQEKFRWLSMDEGESSLKSEPEDPVYGWVVSSKSYLAYTSDNNSQESASDVRVEDMIADMFKWQPDPSKIKSSSNPQCQHTFYECIPLSSLHDRSQSEPGFDKVIEATEELDGLLPLSRSLSEQFTGSL